MSCLATVLLSGVSVFVGITNRWTLTHRLGLSPTPGVTAIRWPNGSFLIVKCSDDVAQDLFFRPEYINYVLQWPNGFILLSLSGTLFLMVSVIALANAKIQLQIAWGCSFVLLNVSHWVAAALPRKMNWGFSAYDMLEQGIDGGPRNKFFTEALWKAILFTKDVQWVKRTESAPQTAVWDEWLIEAEQKARECGQSFGKLIDPIERGDQGDNGVIWDVPKDWDPRDAWSRISRAHDLAASV